MLRHHSLESRELFTLIKGKTYQLLLLDGQTMTREQEGESAAGRLEIRDRISGYPTKSLPQY